MVHFTGFLNFANFYVNVCIYSGRHKNPRLTYKFWETGQPGRTFVVKFSKPGSNDPWHNVRTYVLVHLTCILLTYNCLDALNVCKCKYACEQGCIYNNFCVQRHLAQ